MTNPTSGGAGRRNALLFALLAPLLAALPACSGSSSTNKGGDDAGDPGGPTYAPTFTAVYTEVLQSSCAVAFCHIGSLNNSLALDDQLTAYKSMVNVEAAGVYCAGLEKRVAPGDPGASLILDKVDPDGGIPLCGEAMPGSSRTPLDSRQIAQIKSWITMGAKND
ncbi:MAG: hypothetical protein ACRENE_14300 [Polyangiaceae bacterium]